MKNLAFFLMLLLAIPATAQSGLFGHHSHHPHAPAEQHHPGPLIKVGRHAHPASHHEEPGMNPRDFDDAVRIINNENFDEKRLDAAKHIVSNNPMSARQIVNICKLFTFESNRLEFAKYAYFHCVDPNKYFLVDEVFTFNSSKEELHNFIRKR